jgi:hypothetical protein
MNENQIMSQFMGDETEQDYVNDWNLLFLVINKIEDMHYHVIPAKHQCQIFKSNYKMIIDADFYDDFRLNVIHAITGFISQYSN